MDIRDFDNIHRYKFFLPTLYVVSWAMMLTGPYFYPIPYQIYCFILIAFMGLKSLQQVIWSIIGVYKATKLLNKAQRITDARKSTEGQEVELDEETRLRQGEIVEAAPAGKRELFAFIIPSYQEDEQLIGETLMRLAVHSDARRKYMVFLAMEAHEQGSVDKAQKLIERYSKYFKVMSYSHHNIREFEQKGKASNVSWCAENLEQKEFKKRGIDINDVFLTIIDADSWVPEAYMMEVQERIETQSDLKYKTIFVPTQMFTRNCYDVPLITRIYDICHGAIHFTNMVGCLELSPPLSNYTLSFNLIKRIGFWDTCPDAIGEDFHTTLKAFWKCDGDVRTVDIHIPFNQVNLQTGDGYMADMMARFWQAERHARGCADAAYVLKNMFTKQFNWRTWSISFIILETFMMPALLPWAAAGNIISKIIATYFTNTQFVIENSYIDFIFNFSTLSMFFMVIVFQFITHRATKQLYGGNPGSPLRILECPAAFLPGLFSVTLPSFVIAAFKVMLNRNEYNTAAKKINSGKPVGELPAPASV